MEEKKALMRCPACGGRLELVPRWQTVVLRCRVCSREHGIGESRDLIDEPTWERIASRPCNRA